MVNNIKIWGWVEFVPGSTRKNAKLTKLILRDNYLPRKNQNYQLICIHHRPRHVIHLLRIGFPSTINDQPNILIRTDILSNFYGLLTNDASETIQKAIAKFAAISRPQH